MPRRHAEVGIDLPPDRPHRTVRHHRQGRAHIHARQKAGLRFARPVHALVGQPHSRDAPVLDQRFRHRHTRPHLRGAGRHQPAAHKLQELAEGKDQPTLLVQEGRDVG